MVACIKNNSDSIYYNGEFSVSSVKSKGTFHRCGKEGHWANNCTSSTRLKPAPLFYSSGSSTKNYSGDAFQGKGQGAFHL